MNWQVNVCQACQGINWKGLQWSIEFKVFQSVARVGPLEDDSVTSVESVSDS